ncbi:unnamed protein product [Rhodiola kirilowii]
MCGRARCTLRADDIPRACHLSSNPTLHADRYRPSYNVAPGSYLPVVRRAADDSAVVDCMKWGLIPSFTSKTDKPDHYRMFNARAESLRQKPSFCHLVNKNRCLVVVDGFYEWWKEGSRKQPYYIHFKDGRPLVFAALYDIWKNAEGEVVHTFTIITTSSSPALQWLHDRMPVILGNKASTDTWLNGPSNCNLDTLLKPYEEQDLAWYPVTPAMGKPSFDGPECIKEVPLKAEAKKISTFFTQKPAESKTENNTDGKSDWDHPRINSISCEEEKISKGSNSPNNSACMETDNKVESVFSATGRNDSMIVSPIMQQKDCSSLMKRQHKDLAAIPKLTLEKFDEIYAIPDKKKAKVKELGNKQPTLMQYFGKRQD